ncbi:MAG: cobalamin-dependent protein [Candidatus Riflebacteria bacterium]
MEKLLKSAEELSTISPEAAHAYDARKGLLTERVNVELSDRKDLSDLIGGRASIELMEDNHRNHSMFLTTVLHLNAFHLLASVVPWVYRAYSQHGFSFSYFPVALQAWKAAIRKELPAVFCDEILPVYDWMLNHHIQVVKIVERPTHKAEKNLPPEAEKFIDALLSQDFGRAVKQAEEHCETGNSLELFYQGSVKPAMYEIGNRWERGEISVAEEHLATAVAQIVVSTLQGKMFPVTKRRGRAVVAASVGELHDLGARMISHCLEVDGWEVIFLGANLPLVDLINFVQKTKPEFVGLSVAMPYHLHYVKKVVDKFKADPELSKVPLLIGGQVFSMFPEASSLIPGATIVNDLEDAIKHARRFGSV